MPLNVFYLDDEPDLGETFCDLFSSSEIRVKTFTCPKEMIAAAKSNPPDIFFLDYRLPGMTGDQVALELDSSIPKFLLTGDISVSASYPFQEIFAKPYDFAVIEKIMLQFLRLKNQQ